MTGRCLIIDHIAFRQAPVTAQSWVARSTCVVVCVQVLGKLFVREIYNVYLCPSTVNCDV